MYKKKLLSLLVVAATVISLLVLPVSAAGNTPFTDVKSTAWYADAVTFAYENGLISGYPDGTFRPDTALTRAMFATILWRMEGSPETGTADFTDVASNRYYAKPAAWAQSQGIIAGYPDGTFRPDDPIQRQQVTTILYRYACSKGIPGTDILPDMVSSYTDAGKINNYARDAMNWAIRTGLITGKTTSTLVPLGTATRAEIAMIFMRFCQSILLEEMIIDYDVTLEAYEGLSDFDIHSRICNDSRALIDPYLNENGLLPNDDTILDRAGRAVHYWALQLEDAGIIKTSRYNSTGHSVAFLLKDGSITLYAPPIEGVLSSNSGYSYDVSAFCGLVFMERLSGELSNIGTFGSTASEAANEINRSAPEYTSTTKTLGASATVPVVRNRLRNLAANNTRVIFWEGHGCLYTNPNNNKEGIALFLNEQVTSSKDESYEALRDSGQIVASAGDVWGTTYGITTWFFEENLPQMDGGLFFCGSCCSNADGGNTARVFFNKGFDAYVGTSNYVDTLHSYQITEHVSDQLHAKDKNDCYRTISDALSRAKALFGSKDTGGTEFILSENPNTTSFRLVPSWPEAYANVLKTSSGKFDLIYVDNDTIPELVIAEGGNHVSNAELYTFINGEAVHLGGYGAYGTLVYHPKDNYFGGESVKYEMRGAQVYQIKKSYTSPAAEAGYYTGKTINAANINAMLNP